MLHRWAGIKTSLESPVLQHVKIMLCTHAHSSEPVSYRPIDAMLCPAPFS
jgi:hypothetical protein